MKHHTTSACRENDRQFFWLKSSRLSLLMVLFGLASLAGTTNSFAQLTKTNPQTPNAACDELMDCCTEFTIPAGQTIKFEVESHNTPKSTSEDCFDWDCLEAQSGGMFLITYDGNNQVTVINATLSPVTFTLCGDPYCMSTEGFSNIFWREPSTGRAGTLDLELCGNPGWDACLPCDRVRAWPDETICITRGNRNTCWATTIALSFNPPLPACVQTNGVFGHSTSDWTPDYTTNGSGLITGITFTYVGGPTGGGGLAPCATFCFKLPHCCDIPLDTSTCVDRTYAISGLTTPASPCNPANYACPTEYHALKPTTIGTKALNLNDKTPQNYPNPLTESGSYKTTIPFEVSSAAEAIITILDESGRQVFQEMMEVKSAGKHSFNFTGEQLPAGKYFYSIESPKGLVIVNKSMLIVR